MFVDALEKASAATVKKNPPDKAAITAIKKLKAEIAINAIVKFCIIISFLYL